MNRYKCIGILDAQIAKRWHIEGATHRPILVYDDRIEHVREKHMVDFQSEKNIINSYYNLSKVVKNPDETFYNPSTNILEFYKKKENLFVTMKVIPGRIIKVKTWYPPTKRKIHYRRKRMNYYRRKKVLKR